MSLVRRFLHPQINFGRFPRVVYITLLVLWAGLSYLLYAFAIVVREVLRFFSAAMGSNDYLSLTLSQQHFYDFWFASLAAIVAFGFVTKPVCLLLLPRSSTQRLMVANDQQNLTFYTLHVATKLMVMLGVFAYTLSIKSIFKFYDYKYILLCLPLVMFLSQWLAFNRVFKLKGIRWMLIFLTGTLVMSLLYSRMPPLHASTLDQFILSKYPSAFFKTDLVVVRTQENVLEQDFRPSSTIELGVGFPVDGSTTAHCYVHEFPFDETNYGNIRQRLDNIKDDIGEYRWGDIRAKLYIDKKASMQRVKTLFNILRRANVRQVFFAVDLPEDKGSFHKRVQLRHNLSPYCDTFIDSLSNVTPDATWARCDWLPERIGMSQTISYLFIKQGKVYLNGLLTARSSLYDALTLFFQREPNGELRMFVTDNTEFATYFDVLNSVQKAYYDELDRIFIGDFAFTYRATFTDEKNQEYLLAKSLYNKKARGGISYWDMSNAELGYLIKASPQSQNYFPEP